MITEKTLYPDKRNFRFLWYLFGFTALVMPTVSLYNHEFVLVMFHEGWIWVSLFFLAFPASIQFWGNSQRIHLNERGITQNIFEQFQFKRKQLKITDIKGHKLVNGTLVIQSKNGPAPKFPVGPFSNLSGVIIIPPLFLKDYNQVISHIKSHGNHA